MRNKGFPRPVCGRGMSAQQPEPEIAGVGPRRTGKRKTIMMRFSSLFATATAMMTAGVATAQENLEVIGKPVQGGTGFQPAVTSVAEAAQGLDAMINVIITEELYDADYVAKQTEGFEDLKEGCSNANSSSDRQG